MSLNDIKSRRGEDCGWERLIYAKFLPLLRQECKGNDNILIFSIGCYLNRSCSFIFIGEEVWTCFYVRSNRFLVNRQRPRLHGHNKGHIERGRCPKGHNVLDLPITTGRPDVRIVTVQWSWLLIVPGQPQAPRGRRDTESLKHVLRTIDPSGRLEYHSSLALNIFNMWLRLTWFINYIK